MLRPTPVQRKPGSGEAAPPGVTEVLGAAMQPDASAASIETTDRPWAIAAAISNIGEAQDSFESACDTVKAELSKRHSLLPLIADIALGTKLPDLSRAIATAADRIPTSASKLRTWAATFFVDEPKVKGFLSASTSKGLAALHALPVDQDGADFVERLKAASKVAFAEVNTSLNGASIETAMSAWAAYHPAVVTTNAYAEALRSLSSRYGTQVEPISGPNGHMEGLTHVTASQQAVRVGRKLALVKVSDRLEVKGFAAAAARAARYELVEWISDDLAPFAIEQTKALHGAVRTVDAKDVSSRDDEVLPHRGGAGH